MKWLITKNQTMKTNLSRILTLLLVLFVQIGFAQELTVTGTVTDANGLPIPGVNVLVKEGNAGTQTDFDGNYSIEVVPGETLVFSFVGLETTEYVVANNTIIDVQMKTDAAMLNEVIVTALGITREKQSIGFSQQTVAGESLSKTRETDINNSLAGKVAGVQFQGNPSSGFQNASIRLRGDTGVLYIVDNIKVGASSDINTDDVAEMTVLKGAAATALYGPDGINGVIVITTKKAKAGQSFIKINHSTSMEEVALLPDYQDEYGGGYSQDFDVFTFNPAVHPESWAGFNGDLMVQYYADESWGPKMDGTPVRHWDSWFPGTPEFGEVRPFSPSPNNIKDFYRNGITNNTNVSYSKGGEDYSIRTSLSRVERESVLPGADQTQIQATMNATAQLTDRLEGYANMSYINRSTTNYIGNGYGNLGSNFNQWWQRQLEMDRLEDYRRNGEVVSWNLRGPTNTRPLYWDSPYLTTNEGQSPQEKNALYGKIGLNYDIMEGLSATLEARKTFNQYLSSSKTPWGGLDVPRYGVSQSFNNTDEIFGILNYDTDLSDDFDLNANVGFETQDYNAEALSGSTSGGLQAEGFYSLDTSVDRPNANSSTSNLERRSVFTTASIGFRNILFLDGSARLDWQSTAAADDNRVETYGASASFVFSKLLPQNDILSFGKLRASFAQAPRFPGIYSLSQTYGVGTPYGSFGTISTPGTLSNPNLRGGVREEFELGGELRFANNRLGLDVTYFQKKDDQLPESVSIEPATGFSATLTNAGKQRYKGWEFTLNAVPFETEDFSWYFIANFATLNRFVDALAPGITTNVLAGSWGSSVREIVGEDWGEIYGTAYRRDDAGNKILSSQGVIRKDQDQPLGNYLPDFTGGMSHIFSYKNFSLSVDFDFQSGGQVFSTTKMFNAYSGLGEQTVGNNELGNPVRDPLTGEGVLNSGGVGVLVPAGNAGPDSGGILLEGVDENTGEPVAHRVNPKYYYESMLFGLNEEWLYDNTYVKLRQARLDYAFSKDVLDNTPIKDLNVGVYANNLWLIYSSLEGIDTSELESTWTEGGQLPMTRTVGLNVTLTF